MFREYMSAAPDVRSIMDNQFKNVKTRARLLSKEMWYEWRMKLLDGLKEGLLGVGEGMAHDAELLSQQEALVQPVLPALITEHERLETECQLLQAQADELASCDQEELKEAREKLVSTEEDIEAKRKIVEELQMQLQEKGEGIAKATERKQECLMEIKEAEKVREGCRGWTASEIAALKCTYLLPPHKPTFTEKYIANVEILSRTTGWTVLTASGSTLTLTYSHTLQLFFAPSTFLSPNNSTSSNTDNENSPISLTYIADSHEYAPQSLTTEKRFFLQIMRAQLQCLQQSNATVQELLRFVKESWEKACKVAEEIRLLGLGYITEPSILSDEKLGVKATMLLRNIKTKIEVLFEISASTGSGLGVLDLSVTARPRVVYGEDLKEGKMPDFLKGRVEGGWAKAVRELEARVGARGGK